MFILNMVALLLAAATYVYVCFTLVPEVELIIQRRWRDAPYIVTVVTIGLAAVIIFYLILYLGAR